MLGLLLLTLAEPAVLLDPAGARAEAGESVDPLQAAEIFLLAKDPAGALTRLQSVRTGPEPNRLRLEADAYVDLHRVRRAEATLARLETFPGWASHVAMTRGRLAKRARRVQLGRLGMILFPVCLGLLVLGAGRELLRPGRESLVMAAAWGGGLAAFSFWAPALVPVGGVLGIAGLALAHGGTATVRRTAAPPPGSGNDLRSDAARFGRGHFGDFWAVGALRASQPPRLTERSFRPRDPLRRHDPRIRRPGQG